MEQYTYGDKLRVQNVVSAFSYSNLLIIMNHNAFCDIASPNSVKQTNKIVVNLLLLQSFLGSLRLGADHLTSEGAGGLGGGGGWGLGDSV